LAKGICVREAYEPRNEQGRPNIAYRVGDPKMSHEDGGPSMFERMAAKPYYLNFQKADNKRMGANGAMGGWDTLRARLKGDGGIPMIYFMDCCTETIRTLPAQQRDEDKPEDIDTEGEDHAADETRYACMSRPFIRSPDNVVRNLLIKRDNSFPSGIVLQDDLEFIEEPSRFNSERLQ